MLGISSALISDSLPLRHSMSYLYSVVLKSDFRCFSNTSPKREIFESVQDIDLVVVHVAKPGDGCVQLIKEISEMDGKAVIFALQPVDSALGAHALLAGADDVSVWPCSLHELALRSFIRLGRPLDDPALQGGGPSWEFGAHVAQKARLSAAEAQILSVLFERFGQIVSRDDLSFALDERPWRYGDRKFDVHIAKIRKKLADEFGPDITVDTIRNEGYLFSARSKDFFVRDSSCGDFG